MIPADSREISGDTGHYGASRRTFQLAVVYVLGALITLAMAIPTALYLLIPPRVRSRSGWIDAGDISQLTPGVPIEVSFKESRLDGWKVLTEKKTAWEYHSGGEPVKMDPNGALRAGELGIALPELFSGLN